MIKRQIINRISPLVMVCLFVTPVQASNEDYTYLAIDKESYSAYEYFQTIGASLDDTNINQTYTEYLAGTLGACIYVPQHGGSSTPTQYQSGTYYTNSENAYTITLTGCSSGANNVTFTDYDADKVRYVKPTLSLSNYTSPSSYDGTQGLIARTNDYFVLGVETTFNIATDSFNIIERSGDHNILIEEVRLVEYNFPWRRYRVVLKNWRQALDSYDFFNLTWNNVPNNATVTPLYLGHLNNMSDNMRRLLGYGEKIQELIEDGNEQSLESGYNLNQEKLVFDQESDSLFNLEDDFTSDLDNSIDDIDLNSAGNILSISGFTNALIWTVDQFNYLISPAPIQATLLLCLTVGIALYLIGIK